MKLFVIAGSFRHNAIQIHPPARDETYAMFEYQNGFKFKSTHLCGGVKLTIRCFSELKRAPKSTHLCGVKRTYLASTLPQVPS